MIEQAAPGAVEEVKWRKPSNGMEGVPVWSLNGIICTGEKYKGVVKLTFARGAALDDPSGLFNASLEGGTRRAIDVREGERLDERAFKRLIRAAVELNAAAKKPASRPKLQSLKSAQPKLLSGGNPQIAKADGDAPVKAYVAAMPGWKQDIGRRLDAIISRSMPRGFRKAVKWNSPFYGVEARGKTGWIVSFHCFTSYVKVAFFRGASLTPALPGGSKQKDVRYLDIRQGQWGSTRDEAQLASWVKQAARLPGWSGF